MPINNTFDQIKKINEYGQEFWSARDLMNPLGYTEWRKFEGAIERAKESCKNSGQKIADHFGGADKMVLIGSEAKREISDYLLSRYACYLIAQNGDPRKEEIALAQTYFAIQTRKQEEQEAFLEDQKRVTLRKEMSGHNKKLIEAADNAGVKKYGVFQNYGYMGLYGGLGQKDIHQKKGLKQNQKILDHMGSEELAANLFRATQAEAKLRRENIQGERNANQAHYVVGKKVRKTIREIGGTMPEELPAADGVAKARTRLTKIDQKFLKPKNKQ
jgi:DNA-damage-inducible protein D